MKKDTSNNLKWVIPAIIIVCIMVIAIALNHDELPYKLSSEEMLKEVNNPENALDNSTLIKYTQGKSVFIDLRQPLEYNLNHAGSAINIPAEKILNEDYLNTIKDLRSEGNAIVLYSNTPQKASGAWILLKQIGIDNIRYFNGTYDQLVAKEQIANSLLNEVPVIDTSLLKKNNTVKSIAASKAVSNQPKKVIPQKAAPSVSSGGGC